MEKNSIKRIEKRKDFLRSLCFLSPSLLGVGVFFIVPFGVAFMLPVFIYITTKVGLTTPEMLVSKRKYVILAIFIFAAILTPPDVVSQVLLGVPMLLLYEVGIFVSRLVKKTARA